MPRSGQRLGPKLYYRVCQYEIVWAFVSQDMKDSKLSELGGGTQTHCKPTLSLLTSCITVTGTEKYCPYNSFNQQSSVKHTGTE